MKLKNKKTGEIGYLRSMNWNEIALIIMGLNGTQLAKYNSLAELNEEWEDYKELKDPYFITEYGEVFPLNVYEDDNSVATVDEYKQIGNYFGSREEAEKAVEKLKAWKRLKAHGFRFNGFGYSELSNYARVNIAATMINESVNDDLELLFGGEE